MIRFNDIIGQEPIKKHLQTALAQNNVSHAYLFCGDSGSGRHTLAKAFARALLCEQPTPDHDVYRLLLLTTRISVSLHTKSSTSVLMRSANSSITTFRSNRIAANIKYILSRTHTA